MHWFFRMFKLVPYKLVKRAETMREVYKTCAMLIPPVCWLLLRVCVCVCVSESAVTRINTQNFLPSNKNNLLTLVWPFVTVVTFKIPSKQSLFNWASCKHIGNMKQKGLNVFYTQINMQIVWLQHRKCCTVCGLFCNSNLPKSWYLQVRKFGQKANRWHDTVITLRPFCLTYIHKWWKVKRWRRQDGRSSLKLVDSRQCACNDACAVDCMTMVSIYNSGGCWKRKQIQRKKETSHVM